ncbi:alanyl-tRNA editing protein [Pleionea sediminis]|uniref:alanyl-tRNA editing protein n=1 Tax=Pleionea sediminis TaxID=2569479 RepID=UPI001184AE30|nr:alanyl-tRNA editing protein [Pleionea sediminis]
MTIPLFQDDSYLKECSATVVALEVDKLIVDQSVFYPLGGGQPGDTGEVIIGERHFPIINTSKSKSTPGAIEHHLGEELAGVSPGDSVTLKINWENRYRYMRTHTCMHVFCSLLDYPVTGGNISLEKGRLDFDIPDKPNKDELTELLNQKIAEAVDLNYRWITDEEMLANMDLVKTMSVKPPMGFGKVRLVEIPGIDLQPCGGTHVKNTSEIGRVKISKIENKGKQNKRIHLILEE